VTIGKADYSKAVPPASLDATDFAQMKLLDPGGVDWPRVERTAYLLHQHLRYEYPGPIADLEQRLIILPPLLHGDQRRVMCRIEVSTPDVTRTDTEDEFGNVLVMLHIPLIEQAVDFKAWIVIERQPALGAIRLPGNALADPRLLKSSPLTGPDDAVRQAAEEMRSTGLQGRALVEHIGMWTHGILTYEHGTTTIRTTAAQALALGHGVCQDYAHLMIALCRLCGLSARYVSGHLLGEGGTHAWVEVILPDPERPGGAIVWPFDPANGCPVGLRYLTVAVGRDYYDVAPTSGTYRAAYAGELQTHKSVGITAAEYAPVGADPTA
jgi:transglutaminase-like putative cysteine protease